MFSIVGVVGNIAEVFDFRHLNLLILAGDEHCCDSNQLVFPSLHFPHLAEAIDEVDRNEERLCLEIVLQMNLDEPRYENGPHSVGQLRLVLTHTAGACLMELLGPLHMLSALLGNLYDVMDVATVG